MSDAAMTELIEIVRAEMASQNRTMTSLTKLVRALLELLRDHRDTDREMLELMRLVRQDLAARPKGKK